jgi:glycosyltransferase involved in cell wall biosynthesis
MKDKGSKIFIVMPAFNEELGIRGFLASLKSFVLDLTLDGLNAPHWTLLVVNDGSRDGTARCLEEASSALSSERVRVEYVSLVRNFGHQAALLTGLRLAVKRGADVIITMDADGEHPMNLIPELLRYWLEGSLLVHTSRNPDQRVSKFKGLSSRFYYWLLRVVGHLDIRAGMADFKLWDGRLLRSVRPYLDTCGSTRAFASWLIPDAPVVAYDQDFVDGRTSRFTLRKMLSLGLGGLVRFSDFPIRLAFYVGICALALGSFLIVFAVGAYFLDQVIPGWTSTVALIVFFGGVQCFLLGIYGEYFLRNLFRANLPTAVFIPTAKSEEQGYSELVRGPSNVEDSITQN